MNGKEPPCGGRMLEKTEDTADAVQRRRRPSESSVANTQPVPEAKARRTHRRRKPFVL